jgi:hypothetical protein
MKYQVTTQQGNSFEFDDDAAIIWINLERATGLTLSEAQDKLRNGSLDVLTFIMHQGAILTGNTELKTQDAWVTSEFETFEVVFNDPKATESEVSNEA